MASLMASLLMACTLVSGCGTWERRRCELEPPVLVTRSDGLSFDAVAVALHRERDPLFAWSDARGLSIKLAGDAQAVRIGERCRGGLDLVARPEGAYLACSRSASDREVGDESSSEVALYAIDASLRAQVSHTFGQVGRDGQGVALAADRAAIYVAHHDGSFGEHAIQLTTVRDGRVSQRRLSALGAAAGEPALLAHAGHIYAAYSQLELQVDGKPASSIWIARDGAAAVRVRKTRVHAAAPKLTADARGLLLAYRELPARKSRSELMIARLTDSLRVLAEPRAIGRANGEGAPALMACGQLVTALLPREYGSERFVGINALDGELSALGAGHQFYASGHEFVLASAACVDARGSVQERMPQTRGRKGERSVAPAWLVVAADRAAPGKPGVEAVALAFHCE
jgi:hypothetical protein